MGSLMDVEPNEFSTATGWQDAQHEFGMSQERTGTNSASAAGSTFECTFCHKKLAPKSWKRHEESVHYPKQQWVCMPHNSQFENGSCIFCGLDEGYHSKDPDSNHRVSDCLERSREQRTFPRKDKLFQHIMLFHGCSVEGKKLDAWASSAREGERQWDCGFCDMILLSWDERAKHIAAHFREGKTMAEWKRRTAVDGSDALIEL